MNSVPQNGTKVTRDDDWKRFRSDLSSIYHDINNPISIVAGNVELLQEMARSAGLGSEFEDPLGDVQRAVGQIVSQVERLVELRERMRD